MPATPDRRPGPLEEDEEVRLAANPVPPTMPGAFNYNGTSFQMQDSIGIFNPRSGLPTPTLAGQFLISVDGVTFTAAVPVASDAGLLVDDDGFVVVIG